MGKVRKFDNKSGKTIKKTLWQKLKGLSVDNNNDGAKRKLFYLLSNSIQGGAKVGQHVLVGMNTVLKGIKNNQISIVCVCRDSPKSFFNCLVEACALNSIPIVALPSASSVELANIFSLKRASVFALKLVATSNTSNKLVVKNEDINEKEDEKVDKIISEIDRIDSMMDGVRDAAMAMFTPNFLFRGKNNNESINKKKRM